MHRPPCDADPLANTRPGQRTAWIMRVTILRGGCLSRKKEECSRPS